MKKEKITYELNEDSNIEQLYLFMCSYLSFNKVMQLYRLLEENICYRKYKIESEGE